MSKTHIHVRLATLLALLLLTGSVSAADLPSGRKTYAAVCSGCHGMEGIAVLQYAPSFARGENLDKDDATLIKSVRDGVERMPPWGDILSEREIADAIAYARTLRK